MTKELQEHIDSYQQIAKDYPESMVGNFVYIYWKDDDVWYRAKIIKYLDNSRKFRLLYDDKTEEKLDLTTQYFSVEDERTKQQAMQRKKELRSAGLSNSTSDPTPAEEARKQGKVLGKRSYKTREQTTQKQGSQVIRIDLASAKHQLPEPKREEHPIRPTQIQQTEERQTRLD